MSQHIIKLVPSKTKYTVACSSKKRANRRARIAESDVSDAESVQRTVPRAQLKSKIIWLR